MDGTLNTLDNTICPQDCFYLYPNEAKQRQLFRYTNKQVNHHCTKYNRRIFHMPHHDPILTKCDECIKEGNK